MHFSTFLAAGALAAASLVSAHPGHDHSKEQAVRREFLKTSKRSLGHCAEKFRARGIEARSVQRRQQTAGKLMNKKRRGINNKQRGINNKKRGLDAVLNTSHLSTEGYTADTGADVLFASNSSCILSPEVTVGPYYVAGEYIRKDLTEEQKGVDLTVDIQVVDINTCEPVPNVFVEIWNCNSTGVYSGVVASGNGDSSDESNISATFLRGAQQTDADGAVQFQTLFPGHYTGRTTHTHVLVHHANATSQANGTLMDATASHIGQIFFDQDLITAVEATGVYAANAQVLTTNAEDSILAEEAAANSDPVVQYVLLGDEVEDGIFAWIGFGIDPSAASTASVATYLYAEGGVANANSGMGGSGGGGAGGPPSGAPGAPGSSSTSAGSAVSSIATSGAARR